MSVSTRRFDSLRTFFISFLSNGKCTDACQGKLTPWPSLGYTDKRFDLVFLCREHESLHIVVDSSSPRAEHFLRAFEEEVEEDISEIQLMRKLVGHIQTPKMKLLSLGK